MKLTAIVPFETGFQLEGRYLDHTIKPVAYLTATRTLPPDAIKGYAFQMTFSAPGDSGPLALGNFFKAFRTNQGVVLFDASCGYLGSGKVLTLGYSQLHNATVTPTALSDGEWEATKEFSPDTLVYGFEKRKKVHRTLHEAMQSTLSGGIPLSLIWNRPSQQHQIRLRSFSIEAV